MARIFDKPPRTPGSGYSQAPNYWGTTTDGSTGTAPYTVPQGPNTGMNSPYRNDWSGYGGPADPTQGGTQGPVPDPNAGGTGTGGGAPSQPNYNWLSGYDVSKLKDPSHMTAKYQIGRTLALFDPSKGFADPVITALNALGFGTFAGRGDQLSLSGVTQKGIQAGLDPHDFTGDWIRNWTGTDPNDHSGARWGYAAYVDPATASMTSGGADPFAQMMAAGFGAPSAPAAPPDMSWLTPLMQAFTSNVQQAPAAPIVIQAPSAAPSGGSAPAPTFGGGYVTPGYGTGGGPASAMSVLASQLPQLLADPNNPLARQILQQFGVQR